ncbi:FMN-binding negative transcriptional regulator [Lysobacter maris]|uniref:FMN-binding negative transcriptional regulator n=2 Tax=Marilutibacter maris TaxID=1605891 RepID=A0A508AQV5_9GAMM|nr:FMN-binding negative transcriptional regulator [Lysobacter maris]KAB8181815.1 FMN-binding negative transcriptional regulator [Lysobacter maris]
MRVDPKSCPRNEDAIHRLVRDHPFAHLISSRSGELLCTPLPLILDHDVEAPHLIGHLARSNPQAAALVREPRALVVFSGTHGYISPSWMRDRTQAPTWNYESVQFDVEVDFDEDAGFALERLVARMEHGRRDAWRVSEMGDRYPGLSRAVIAFRARIIDTRARFKLGQDERADVFDDILAGLERERQHELLSAMVRQASRASGD